MGNYRNPEIDFVYRTLQLISQYETDSQKYLSENQYNHTLLINCLLGLIVFPKEKSISYLPNENITQRLRQDLGIITSTINNDYQYLKDLIIAMRHSIAHFDIDFKSENESYTIDKIIFKDNKKEQDYIIASFVPEELLSFIRYYGSWLINNIQKYKISE